MEPSDNRTNPSKPQDRTRAILRSTLEPEARLVAVAIADHMDADGEAWPNGATLAAETGYCERTVLDVIGHGLETGWLACRWLPGRRRVLRVVWERLNDADRPNRNAGGRKVRKAFDPERGAESIQNGAPEGDDPFRRPVPVRSGAPLMFDPAPGAGSIRNGAPPKQTNEATIEATSEATTFSAPAPAVAEPAPKAKRSPKVKGPVPTHARDVIAAWCDVFKDANGAPYPVNGREVGTLSRLAGDYVTGDEWEAKLGVLRTGMGAYIRDPRRFPPGPPTVGGFAQDPARWMQATGAPPAKPNGRPSFAQMLLNRNAAERPQPVNVTPRSTT